jgi:hypothetical protein
MAVQTKIQFRRDTAANWTTAQTAAGATPILAAGEIGYITSGTGAGSFKIGDGTTLWGSLKLQSDASLLTGAASLTTLTTSGNVTVGGNLTVNGTTTSINSSTLQVDDKNIELGSVAAITGVSASGEAGTPNITVPSTTGLIVGMTITRTAGTLTLVGGAFISSIDGPTSLTMSQNAGGTGPGSLTLDFGGPSDTTADGAGLTVLGNGTPNNKTWQWSQTANAWSSNQDINISAGKVYEINAVTVLSNTQVLGYSIATANGASTIVARDASGNFSAGTITATLFGTANLAANLTGGTANKGEIVYMSGVNTTSKLTATTTNNQVLAYNTSTNAPFWLTPTLSNTYFGTTTTADQLRGALAASNTTGTGNLVFATSPTFVTPVLGTPSSGNLVSTTGYTVDNLANTTANTITFLKTPNSLNLLNAVTDETGTGNLVFSTSPSLTTPTLGVATATSLNKLTFTAPATSATLTLANGSTLQTIGAFFINATATANTDITFPTSGTLATQTYVGSATVAQANNLTGATANLIPYQSAANTTSFIPAPGGSNYVLTASATGAPTWAAPASTGVTNLVAGNGITVSGSTGAVTVNTNASYATTWTTTQRVNVSSDVLAFGIKANTTQTANLIQAFAGDGTTTLLSLSPAGTLFAVTIDGGTA